MTVRKVIGGIVVASPVIGMLIWAGLLSWWIPIIILGMVMGIVLCLILGEWIMGET